MNICIVSIKTFSYTISFIIYEISKELTNTYTRARTYLTETETRGKTASSLPVFLLVSQQTLFCNFSAIVITCLWSQVHPDMQSLSCQAGLYRMSVLLFLPGRNTLQLFLMNFISIVFFFNFSCITVFYTQKNNSVTKQRGTKLSKGCEVECGHQSIIEKSEMTECPRTEQLNYIQHLKILSYRQ